MVNLNVNNNIQKHALTANDFHIAQKQFEQEGLDTNIFSRVNNTVSEKNVEILNEQLNKVKDKNGCFMSLWNDVKNVTGTGTSDEKCDEVIEAYSKDFRMDPPKSVYGWVLLTGIRL